ncbi:MAG: hypothetical protein J1E98_03850 [Lachnospiraceae bacterium]|nr:hypothetical protein [Lachnospiraceae bacterium]
MTYEKLVEIYEQLSTNTFERCLYIEYILFCNFASENEFNNYFNIEEIKDAEFFKLVDFLHNHNCYNLLYRVLRDNRERIATNPDINTLKDIDFRSDIDKRMERFAF